jgi:tRNA(Ile)-lysidine synthase
MYHCAVHKLPQSVLAYIHRHELLRAGDRVGVAVSGGADSVALLRILLELRQQLGIVLSVVHLNHQLRGAESDADEVFVRELAGTHGLELHCESADVKGHAVKQKLSLETAARQLRCKFFEKLLTEAKANKIATAHTLDDQAETVLLRLLRGTGLRGLAAIRPKLQVADVGEEVCGEIVRPLLAARRAAAAEYLHAVAQPWREDESNQKLEFTRNRVRHRLLPLLQREFNAAVVEKLGELAEIAHGEEEFWNRECTRLFSKIVSVSTPDWANFYYTAIPNAAPSAIDPAVFAKAKEPGPAMVNLTLNLTCLNALPLGARRRLIHSLSAFGIPLEFKDVERVLYLAQTEDEKQIHLAWGWKVVRHQNELQFLTADLRGEERVPSSYEYVLDVPGRVVTWEPRLAIEASIVEIAQGCNREQLIDASFAQRGLLLRNWRAGDRFWPSHTREPKKIKELLQDRHITGSEKKRWPVVASGEEVVWLRGFGVRRDLQAKGDTGILIQEAEEE